MFVSEVHSYQPRPHAASSQPAALYSYFLRFYINLIIGPIPTPPCFFSKVCARLARVQRLGQRSTEGVAIAPSIRSVYSLTLYERPPCALSPTESSSVPTPARWQ